MIDMNEVKSATETLAEAFEEYKDINDQRLGEIERKGSSDVLYDEKLARMDRVMNDLQDQVSSVKTALSRPSKGGASYEEKGSEYKSAFMEYVAKGLEYDVAELGAKEMSVIADQQGGYMAPAEMADRIITRQFDTSPMRQIATVMQVSSEAVEMLRDTDEAEAQWVSELGSRDDTSQGDIGRIRIPVHELHAQPKATQKLLDDAVINVEEWLVGRVANKFTRRENAAFISGDGVGQPRGFLSYSTAAQADDSRNWGVIEHVATGTDAGFSSTDGADSLITLMHKLKAGYLPKAKWLMPRSVVDVVRKLKDGNSDAYVWQPSLEVENPAPLLGFPVIMAEDMPAIASGSLSVAFGNFEEAYTIVDRIGMRVLRDPYTAAPFVKFRCSKRVGGDVVNFDALKLLRFATA
ncbi:MAG: phage major capsid protein [Bdellovibrionales bacterium]